MFLLCVSLVSEELLLAWAAAGDLGCFFTSNLDLAKILKLIEILKNKVIDIKSA